MRVLMYGWEFPPHISGGLGVACYGITQGLMADHIRILLVLPHSNEAYLESNEIDLFDPSKIVAELADEVQSGAISINYIKSNLRPYVNEETYQRSALTCDSLATQSASACYGADLISEVSRYAVEAGKLAETLEHDIIHAHDWLTILAGVEAKRISHKPLIFHVHATEFDRSGDHINHRIFEIEQYGMMQADRILAVSEYTKHEIVEKYGISPDKISVVYNGLFKINTSNVPPRKSALKTVLFLGRITHQKGLSYFIEAANKILSKRKDVQFVVVGEGDLLKSSIERVAALQIGSHVHFTGFLDEESVQKMYQLSDVYVMPSVSEPFGISCLEALAQGVPTVLSRRSGASEVLNHVITVDFWDINEIASAIVALIDYPLLREEMLKNSKVELDKLSWRATARAIEKAYARCM